jgi:putative Holliday junction resolvase
MPGGGLLLAFDFGKRRIGVAVGQPLTRTATALCTLKSARAGPDWRGIGELIGTWRPRALVVGLPRSLDGDEHELTRAARRFGNQLAGRYRLPVHWVDERLSSAEAASRVQRPGRRADLDREAARLILETWLGQ